MSRRKRESYDFCKQPDGEQATTVERAGLQRKNKKDQKEKAYLGFSKH